MVKVFHAHLYGAENTIISCIIMSYQGMQLKGFTDVFRHQCIGKRLEFVTYSPVQFIITWAQESSQTHFYLPSTKMVSIAQRGHDPEVQAILNLSYG